MPSAALYTELKAKPGQEEALASLLTELRSIVAIEPGNLIWTVVRFDAGRFGIMDTFDTHATRQTHLSGNTMRAITERARDLLDGPPAVHLGDVLADYTRS